MLVFIQKTAVCFFLYCFVGMVREKRRGRVGRGEDAWCVQYDSIELFCSQRTKNHHKFKLMSLMMLCSRAYKSRAHFMWTTNVR